MGGWGRWTGGAHGGRPRRLRLSLQAIRWQQSNPRTGSLSTSQGRAFDGGLHLGEPSVRFKTESKIQFAPLRDESDTGFNDLNPRSGPRNSFIRLSIVSPLQ
jgi:hypothetical protein